MRLTDLDQQIFVPITDETKGGATYEIQTTVGEFFKDCCDEFAPEVVDAIPVEWLREFDLYYSGISGGSPYFRDLLKAWQKEQEAQDG